MDTADKRQSDLLIYEKLKACPKIISAETVLVYISTEIEVDTIAFINEMLRQGKTVAVPKCEGKNMRFIKIKDLSDTVAGAFNIPEPKGNDGITDFNGSVCITPALSFNKDGYRLGYGGGYYDRFGKDYGGIMIGICYEDFIGDIPLENYDRKVHILITDKEIRSF